MAVEECIEGFEHRLFEVVLDRLVRHPVQHLRSIRQHTSACVSIRQHASACVSIRQHTSACVSIRQPSGSRRRERVAAPAQHTSAYVSMRSIHQHTSPRSIHQHTSPAQRSIHQHTSPAQHTSAYVSSTLEKGSPPGSLAPSPFTIALLPSLSPLRLVGDAFKKKKGECHGHVL
jgi:hypothetical protein